MQSVRIVSQDVSPVEPCSRCGAFGSPWDRIAGRAFCPECQESLAQGTTDPLVIRTEKRRCAGCGHSGTVRFVTFPLGSGAPLEFDLCPVHFRALLARRLDPATFRRLRRRLGELRVSSRSIFLLHEAFYDDRGRALQPALDVD